MGLARKSRRRQNGVQLAADHPDIRIAAAGPGTAEAFSELNSARLEY